MISAKEAKKISEDITNTKEVSGAVGKIHEGIQRAAKIGKTNLCITKQVQSLESEEQKRAVFKVLNDNGYKVTDNSGFDQRDNTSWDDWSISW